MKEYTNNEKYAEKWFLEHGYAFIMKKQLLSKTTYDISKNGIQSEFSLPYELKNVKKFMMQFEQNWLVLEENRKLKEMLSMQKSFAVC